MTLRQKLTILFCVFSLIPMAVVTYFNSRTARHQMEQMTRYQLECLCADRSGQLQTFFKNLRLNVQMLSDHRLVKDMMAEYSRAYSEGGISGDRFRSVDSLFHGRLVELNEKYGFEDMLFVSPRGDVVISATKGADWATNLLHGPSATTHLARCFKGAETELKLVDFEFHPPAGKATAFIGAPSDRKSVV